MAWLVGVNNNDEVEFDIKSFSLNWLWSDYVL